MIFFGVTYYIIFLDNYNMFTASELSLFFWNVLSDSVVGTYSNIILQIFERGNNVSEIKQCSNITQIIWQHKLFYCTEYIFRYIFSYFLKISVFLTLFENRGMNNVIPLKALNFLNKRVPTFGRRSAVEIIYKRGIEMSGQWNPIGSWPFAWSIRCEVYGYVHRTCSSGLENR